MKEQNVLFEINYLRAKLIQVIIFMDLFKYLLLLNNRCQQITDGI